MEKCTHANDTHPCLVTLLPWSLPQPSDPTVKFRSVMRIENPQNAKQEGDVLTMCRILQTAPYIPREIEVKYGHK